MIHTATQKLKFKMLARKVRQLIGNVPIDPDTICVGVLERLWHCATTNTPRGDIGKLSDEIIAEAVGWYGDPTALINALVEAGWIDRSDEHRLLIHDWHDHAPKFIKESVRRKGGFITTPLEGGAISHDQNQDDDPLVGGAYRGGLKGGASRGGLSNLTKPNQTQPNQTQPAAAAATAEKQPSSSDDPEDEILLSVPIADSYEVLNITRKQLEIWQGFYPKIDVLTHARECAAYLATNEAKQKPTEQGTKTYVNGWLGRKSNDPKFYLGPMETPSIYVQKQPAKPKKRKEFLDMTREEAERYVADEPKTAREAKMMLWAGTQAARAAANGKAVADVA